MERKKHFIEIGIEFPYDEGEMTTEAWNMYTEFVNHLEDFARPTIIHISKPYPTPRPLS